MTFRHDFTGVGRRLIVAAATLGLMVGFQTAAPGAAQAAPGASITISGTTTVGETLTAGLSGFPCDASGGLRWFHSGSWAELGTGSTYVLQPADAGARMYVETTCPSPYTWAGATSGVIAAADFTSLGTPEVTGTPEVGQTLLGFTGTWSPTQDSFTYQWLRDGSEISGADSLTYTAVAADAGKKLSLRVTAVKAGYNSANATSAETAAVAGGAFTPGTPTVAGTTVVGASLWADVGTWDPTPESYSYQWLRNGSAITGATGETYRLVAADLGTKISVRVTAHKSGTDDASATSAQSATVTAAPAATVTAFTASDVVIGSGRCVSVPVSATYQVSTYEAWAVTKVTLTSKVTNKRGKKLGTVTLTGSGPDFTPVGSVLPNRRADLVGTATGTFQWCTGDYLGAIKFAAPKGTWTGTYTSGAVGGTITGTLTATGHVKATISVATPKLKVTGTKRTLTTTVKTWVPDVKGWRALAGSKVDVQKLVNGSWVKVKTVRISHSGKVKTSWKATTATSYRLFYGGNSVTVNGVSAVVTG